MLSTCIIKVKCLTALGLNHLQVLFYVLAEGFEVHNAGATSRAPVGMTVSAAGATADTMRMHALLSPATAQACGKRDRQMNVSVTSVHRYQL